MMALTLHLFFSIVYRLNTSNCSNDQLIFYLLYYLHVANPSVKCTAVASLSAHQTTCIPSINNGL